MVANLPLVNNEQDAWFNNRLINEALLELNHHGKGPVQINIPIPKHTDSFSSEKLPIERKINRWNMETANWSNIVSSLINKKILIVCGEGSPLSKREREILTDFCTKTDSVILCDKMSNCHTEYSIENAFAVLQALAEKDFSSIAPDIIISIRANFSFNPELKGVVSSLKTKKYDIENWFVHPCGKVIDPYQGILTNIFEMNEFSFFKNVAESINTSFEEPYFAESWKVISESIDEPNTGFCHINAVGKLLSHIPQNSSLHLANSNSVRLAQLYKIDSSVEIHCNRGSDGIDGCMSSAVGYASETNELTYLIIGDLTFFYDMNALWNPQIRKNLRIFLDNNGGGAIMHMPNRPQFATELLPKYLTAHHNASAKAWAEDRGFKYFSARNLDELEVGINKLTDKDAEGPILLEVFTNLFEDVKNLREYYVQINRSKLDNSLKTCSKKVIKKVCSVLGIEPSKLRAVLGR